MKTNRTKLLCALLSCLLLLGLLPAGMLAVGAADGTETVVDESNLPAVLPDGAGVDKTKLWVPGFYGHRCIERNVYLHVPADCSFSCTECDDSCLQPFR